MTLKQFIKFTFLIALLYAGNAAAISLPLACILTENTNPEACAIGEAQLRIDVTDVAGTTGIDIRFTNIDSGLTINDPILGVIDPNPGIQSIYFQTSLFNDVFNLGTITKSPILGLPLVRFLDPQIPSAPPPNNLNPPNLPGGQEVGFTADFGVNADLPSNWGFDTRINESTLNQADGDFLNLRIVGLNLSAFEQAFLANDFKIGLHVQSFGEESASFVALSAIPVPAAFWLFGTALIGFVGFSRRRSIGA
jgi:hypothetical protein